MAFEVLGIDFIDLVENILRKDNTEVYSPSAPYHPATKKYVEDLLAGYGGGDMYKSAYDSDDDGKVNSADTADSVPWSGVTGKPDVFTPAVHSHVEYMLGTTYDFDGDGVVDKSEVAIKLETVRTITLSGDATGSVNFDGSSNVTLNVSVDFGAHGHEIMDITGLQDALDGKAAYSHGHYKSDIVDFTHTHVSLDISDFTEAASDAVGGILFDTATVNLIYDDVANQIRADVLANTSNQKVAVSKNSVTATGTRKQVNFKEGSYITITVADNATNDAVDVTVTGTYTYTHPATHSADIITDGTTNKAYTATEKTKLAGVADNANNYTHPTGDGNLHVAATGTTNNGKVLKSGSTAGSISWGSVDWSELTGKPTTFAPSGHSHPGSEVTSSVANADKLATPRAITLAGDVTGTANFDGSSGVSITATVVDDSHDHTNMINYDDVLMNTNPFGGKRLYINSINNAMFRATERWTVTGNLYLTADSSLVGAISQVSLAYLFDGSYESGVGIPAGQYAIININFNGNYPGYPYGNLYLSHYYTGYSQSAVLRTYSNYEPHGIGWHEYAFSDYLRNGTSQLILISRNPVYAVSQMEFIIYAPATTAATITQIDYQLDRPGTNPMPLVDKFRPNDLFSTLYFRNNTNVVKASIDPGTGGASFNTLESTVTTGTAPLTVASTTRVSNLNVERVDDCHVNDAGTDIFSLWTADKIIDYTGGLGTGDMQKATYDTTNNGIVDNAEKVNGVKYTVSLTAPTLPDTNEIWIDLND